MGWLEVTLVLVGGFTAGLVNTVVGSGTLVSFPLLVAVGYSPVEANVANSVGLVPGSIAGVVGYRQVLAGRMRQLARLTCVAAVGGVCGGLLLLVLPAEVFDAAVPLLIGFACLLMLLQPRISRLVSVDGAHSSRGSRVTAPAVFAISVYGGYFSAAQGILLFAVLSLLLSYSMQRVNGIKNLLQAVVNLTAAVLFVAVSEVEWFAAGLIAAGSVAGALIGARVAQRLSPAAMRGVVLVVGVCSLVYFILR